MGLWPEGNLTKVTKLQALGKPEEATGKEPAGSASLPVLPGMA